MTKPTKKKITKRKVKKSPEWWSKQPSYKLAYEDDQFMALDEMRPIRLNLELEKAELILRQHKIESTIVVFGGTRIVEPKECRKNIRLLKEQLSKKPRDAKLLKKMSIAKRVQAKSGYYEEARRFSELVSCESQANGTEYVIVTGGGPGIMEAANRGAFDCDAQSIGLNITLPMEQAPNDYITPELCFQFRYFAIRKMHFLMRAKALVAFPGGYGTLDELFEALTLVQTDKAQNIPIILFGRNYWTQLINFEFLVAEGTIEEADLKLFRYADTAEEAWELIKEYNLGKEGWTR